jgi:TPR repeat protein
MKKSIKLNIDDNHLSWGNFCRIIKENSINKTSALQIEIFCTIFNINNINDTTVNNYCVGCRAINNEYKQIFLSYRKKYKRNKNILIETIVNLLSIINGSIYSFSNTKDSLMFINDNKKLRDIVIKLYNISKNDRDISKDIINNLNNYINNSNLYEAICEILFFIILEKKQPIYEKDLKKQVIENILSNTSISSNELEEYLNLKFAEGINYNYILKRLANNNNTYACYEIGMNEYKGYVMGYPRYDVSYKYFYKASLSNHPSACYMIGQMYINKLIGNGDDKKMKLAYDYINKAYELGSITAINCLGLMYLNGIYPIKKDINKAIYYFEMAGSYNYTYAFNNLGKIYEEKHYYKMAFNYYLESAKLGESWACNKIGEYYRKGILVDIDLEKAFQYYHLAIDVEIRSCCFYAYYNLAKYYYLNGCGNIVKIPNKKKAIKYFEIASNNGNLLSTIELIYIYTDIYVNNKDKRVMDKIKELVSIVEHSSLYNDDLRIKIEDNLRKIKNNKGINLDIIK